MRVLRLLLKELSSQKRLSFLFILNLSLGLSSFIALEGFKSSLDGTIKQRSKGILGADYGVRAKRPYTDEEKQLLKELAPPGAEESRLMEMLSMVVGPQKTSRLVQLKAIENNYPFYGEIKLKDYGVLDLALKEKMQASQGILVYPELLTQLKVKVGEEIIIGNLPFKIFDIIEQDSAAGLSTNMAPRIYLHFDQLQNTGLVQPRSLINHFIVYKTPSLDSEDLSDLRQELFDRLETVDIRVFTHENSSRQMTRMFRRLSDFLGLTSLVALFLSALGGGFLFRVYLRGKVKDIAILLSLGATPSFALRLYSLQVLILGLLGFVGASLLSTLLVPGLGQVVKGILPYEITFSLSTESLILGFLVGTLGCLLTCLPLLLSVRNVKPGLLLTGSYQIKTSLGQNLLALTPAFFFFWGFSIWLSHSFKVGSLFVLTFIISSLLLGLLALVFLKFCERLYTLAPLSLALALRDMSRQRFTSLVSFLAIGLASLLLNLIPQIQNSLDQELTLPGKSALPSLFMFDIQDEQLPDFHAALKAEGIEAKALSPMIRARLKKVNGKEFDKGKGYGTKTLSREQEREMRFRNRGMNLSIRAGLSESERILAGKPIEGSYVEGNETLPKVSLETRFADRLGLKIGDELEFDVEGVPVMGQVENLRTIRWTSFQPNFFITFQPGVLEPAPKTHIATLPGLNQDKKNRIQNLLVEKLPNITIVDVSRVVQRINQVMTQMSFALKFMSFLCLVAGMCVLYSIANHLTRRRRFDIGLMKTFGATGSLIQGQFLWQFLTLSASASLLGILLSFGVNTALCRWLLQSVPSIAWQPPLISFIATLILTLLVTSLAIRGALRTRTRELFSN